METHHFKLDGSLTLLKLQKNECSTVLRIVIIASLVSLKLNCLFWHNGNRKTLISLQQNLGEHKNRIIDFKKEESYLK